ncbi:hypothetical protein Q1695_010435 [Nippostrongylus brasiliensis]|nr:hypothetical protein Q1695_010435 [Nippostrongylus brasiliensis]
MYAGRHRLSPLQRRWYLIDFVYRRGAKAIFHTARSVSYGRPFRKKRNYYELLGVKQDATQEEIKAAFYTKSKELHPDKGNNGDSTSAFVDLKEAYDVLRRPVDRRAYDDSQRNLQEQIYRDPYYHYNPYRDQQRQRESQWSRVWRENPGSTGHMKDSDFQRRSNDQWYFILKWTVIGTFLVFLYNIGFVMQLKYRERRLAKLVDEDEIAKSFMRQPEVRAQQLDRLEMVEIGRILKGDIDEAWKRRNEGLQGKNPNEIREEYRWLRAVQDADHTRRVKAERSERRRKDQLAARGVSIENEPNIQEEQQL